MICGCEAITCANQCLVNLTGYYNADNLIIVSACGKAIEYVPQNNAFIAVLATAVVVGVACLFFGSVIFK